MIIIPIIFSEDGGEDGIGKFAIISSIILCLISVVLFLLFVFTENFTILGCSVGCLGLATFINTIILLITVIKQ